MRKTFSNLLRVVCATVLLFSFAGKASAAPDASAIAGDYKVTAKVTLGDDVPEALQPLFKNSFEFKLQPVDFDNNVYTASITGFITSNSLNFDYTASTGKLSVQNY